MDSLLFVGGGNMARSLIGGIIAAGHRAEAITVCEPNSGVRESLAGDFGVNVATELDTVSCAQHADAIILAVKPQVMAQVAEGLAPALEHRPVVISIAAGINCHALSHWLGSATPIVRAMPNTPAAIGQGITALIGNGRATEKDVLEAQSLMAAVGQTLVLQNEQQIDAVTGVSGSGPAYVFLMIEALAAAGVNQGLPEDMAMQLAQATVAGAGALAVRSEESAEQLRINVTSPNGTTQAALEVLMRSDAGLSQLVDQAVSAARQRSQELSNG